MRTLAFVFTLIISLSNFTTTAIAQSATQSFPYDAAVLDDEVYARSGPGRQYYPTSRFRKGDRVTVVRHDPGGWFMIDPPPGSFAWVRKEFVKRDVDRGVITSENPVVAWVGTSFGDDHFVEQRRLQKGEEVEILAEKSLKDERGEVAYLKIKPPRGHYRWIPGSKVIHSDRQLAAAQATKRGDDPFSKLTTNDPPVRDPNVAPVDPSEFGMANDANSAAPKAATVPQPKDVARRGAPTPDDLEEEPLNSRPFARSSDTPETASPFRNASDDRGPASSDWQRLTELDNQFQSMIQRDTRDWEFTGIERDLRGLQTQPETESAATRRLALLDKYKQIKLDYDQFQNIIDETNRRDAELAAKQKAAVTGTQPPAIPPQPTVRPANTNHGAVPIPNPNTPPPWPGRSPAPAIRTRPTPTSQPAMPGAKPAAPTPTRPPATTPGKGKLSGAGIIQRSSNTQPGAPRHVLVHPDGRVLAYLDSDGVNLDRYIGESMGLEGERYFRPDLRSDYLVVKSAQPVKLKP